MLTTATRSTFGQVHAPVADGITGATSIAAFSVQKKVYLTLLPFRCAVLLDISASCSFAKATTRTSGALCGEIRGQGEILAGDKPVKMKLLISDAGWRVTRDPTPSGA